MLFFTFSFVARYFSFILFNKLFSDFFLLFFPQTVYLFRHLVYIKQQYSIPSVPCLNHGMLIFSSYKIFSFLLSSYKFIYNEKQIREHIYNMPIIFYGMFVTSYFPLFSFGGLLIFCYDITNAEPVYNIQENVLSYDCILLTFAGQRCY